MRIDSTGPSDSVSPESPGSSKASQSEINKEDVIAFNCTQTQEPVTFGKEPKGNRTVKDAMANAGEHLKYVPGLGNVLKGIGNSDEGALNTLSGGLGGVTKTAMTSVEGIVTGGSRNPAQALTNAYVANVHNFDK
ncbi:MULTISPECIES: hypothetical protein [Pseudomonas]|uniref:Uncharacterized protein n=1 Tax=Pseudomonas luteola TaxID=47886 RepID=A0A2X2DCJ9_PSELU|nr:MULTISPECIES: hypothetical protein [Pseudomonas]SPZ16701.1 Uncharacterised protein [Pseudomonas luteola]